MSSAPGTTRIERAHAKINLILRILARETSGYHGIETLFQKLSLHDVVTVRTDVPDRILLCDGPTMPTDGLGAPEDNLAWRAAQLYCTTTGWDTGWNITIDKRIPVGGGLGGGSADAAAVLRAFESMCPNPLGDTRLLELAGLLGADVPFLVTDASRAWAWGRGDRLMLLPALESVPVVLFTFREGVNTGAAYRAYAELRATEATPIASQRYSLSWFSSWSQLAELAVNDFERVVPSLHAGVAEALPNVRAIASDLRRRNVYAIGMLSGSGATCFLLVPPGGLYGFDDADSALVTSTA